MTIPGRKSGFELRKYHTIFLEIGLIAALLIFIVAMRADIPGEKKTVDLSNEKEAVTLKQIPQTTHKKQVPPPADPHVEPKAPNDDPIIDEPKIDDLDSDPLIDTYFEPPPKENSDKQEKIHVVVEQEPEIIGGQKALYDKLTYPRSCKRAGIEGKVILRFTVNTDGSVQNIEVVRGIGGGCDKAAVEALKEIKFKPGRQQGNPVRVRFSWPIHFQLK